MVEIPWYIRDSKRHPFLIILFAFWNVISYRKKLDHQVYMWLLVGT